MLARLISNIPILLCYPKYTESHASLYGARIRDCTIVLFSLKLHLYSRDAKSKKGSKHKSETVQNRSRIEARASSYLNNVCVGHWQCQWMKLLIRH
jgi:IS30 family transposase